jgi:hypothetical protein
MLDLRCDDLTGLHPVHEESPFQEIPDTIDLCEPVKIADGSDHESTLTSMNRYMMRQAITDTSRFSAIQYDRALAVEVSCGLVLVEVIEHGCECIAALQLLRWNIALGVHVYNETCVFGE